MKTATGKGYKECAAAGLNTGVPYWTYSMDITQD
jgi:phage-related protein